MREPPCSDLGLWGYIGRNLDEDGQGGAKPSGGTISIRPGSRSTTSRNSSPNSGIALKTSSILDEEDALSAHDYHVIDSY